jgi:proteasome lid subunit RPN8/RPN11
MSDAVSVSQRAFETMTRHASAAYPHECCGAMIEVDGEIVEALPLSNVTEEEARRRFLVGAGDYRKAEARADAIGGTLAGFYHSHPDHPASPSQTDLDAAWPNLSYVIISVAAGAPGAVTCWRLRDDRAAFDERAVLCPTRS